MLVLADLGLHMAAPRQDARDQHAEHRPGRPGEPSGGHVRGPVHAEIDASDAHQQRQDQGDGQLVDLLPPPVATSR